VRRRQYSYRTEQSYLVWIERFARQAKTESLTSRGEVSLLTSAPTRRFMGSLDLQVWTRIGTMNRGLLIVVVIVILLPDYDYE
jgi:hypothetical protein